MPGTPTFTPIPSSPQQPANAATFNTVYTQLNTNLSNHENGATGTRHVLTEIDSAALDNVASSPALAISATDLNTRMLQFAEALAKVSTGSLATQTWAAAINGLASTANLTTIAGAIGNATTPSGVRTAIGAAASGANTDITSLGTLTSLTVSGTLTATLTGNATGTASNITGILNASSHPALTGDVTSSAGSLATTVAMVGGNTAAAVNTAIVAVTAATNLNTNSTIVKRDGSGNFSAGVITASLTGNATNITGVLTAASFPALTGDVTTIQGNLATTVATVGGYSAANVAAGATLANAATNLNTASAIVKRDASGNFSAGTVTATTFVGAHATTDLTGVLSAAQFPALTGDVTTSSGSLGTTVAFVGGYSAANVAAGSTAANAATNTNTVNAIVKRDASGNFIAGTITASLSGNATNITGVLAATSFPAVSGDVTIPQGTLTASVSTVGGSSAANVHAAELLANAATNANTANAIVRRDASGDFTAGAITANVIGTATNVTGTVAVANGGTGQTAYSGYAILAANAGGTALAPIPPGSAGQVLQIISGAPTWATTNNLVQNYSLPMSKLSDGAVIPDPSPPSPPNSMRVYVNAAKKFDGAGNAVQWSGGYVDLTSYVPGSGTSVWVMIYLNATAAVYVASGVASATPQKPQAVGGNTPLAYVLLYAGQINVAASDIYDWRTDFAAFAVGGGTGSGYSGVGHLHGQGQESFVATAALDELRTTTPNVAGMTVYVQPGKYSDTNSVVQNFTGGASTVIAKPVANPYYVAVGLSQSGSITLNYGAENAAPVKPAFLNATDIPLAYVLVRTGSTRTILNDDNVNALIYDARRAYTFASTAAAGIVSVSNGGTGSSTFAGAGFVYTPGSTAPLTYVPAIISTTVGLGFNPTVTPAGANADLFQGGGGIVATGSTNVAGEVNGLHILASTKTGTGTIATFNGVKIEAQTIGTTNNTLNVVGNATISGNMTVGGGLTFNSNLVITAATAVVAQFNSNSAAGIVTVNNHASGATGLIESWRVNGVEQANMGPGGVLTAKGVTNTGNGSISGTLGVTGVATLSGGVIASTIGTASGTGQLTIPAATSDTIATIALAQTFTNKTLTSPTIGGGSLSGTFSGAATFSGALTLSAAGAALTVTNNATIGGTLGVTGATTLAALSATSSAISGNETVGGTLGVTGVATLTVAPIFTALTGLLVGNGASAVTAANLTSGSILIGAGTGAPTTLAATGANQFVVATGANTWAVQSAATARASIGLSYYDYSTSRIGVPANNETIDIFHVARAMTFPANFAGGGTYARAGTASTGTTAIDVQRSAAGGAYASIGTITFSTAAVATFATASGAQITLAADDRIRLVAPAALNALADISITLQATY